MHPALMAWRLRKSRQILPGVRLNLSRRGVGFSAGPRGLKVGRGADGRYRRTISVPGTGLYNTTVLSSRKQPPPMTKQPDHPFWTAPPNWPQPPLGWAPPAGWQPDPAWGPAPEGWQFWQTQVPPQQAGAAWVRKHPKTTAGVAVLALLFMVGVVGGGDEPPGTRQGVVQASDRGDERLAAEEKAAADQAGAEEAEEARKAAADAAAQKAAEEEAARAAAEEAARIEAARIEAARIEAERVAAERVAAEQAAAEAAAAEAARREAEQRAAAEAAARAEAERRAAAAAAAPAPAAGTDPRFGTCKEAIAAGHGPYRRGVDPEYNWYRDADSDGINCER
jgi:hypothetical protein